MKEVLKYAFGKTLSSITKYLRKEKKSPHFMNTFILLWYSSYCYGSLYSQKSKNVEWIFFYMDCDHKLDGFLFAF